MIRFLVAFCKEISHFAAAAAVYLSYLFNFLLSTVAKPTIYFAITMGGEPAFPGHESLEMITFEYPFAGYSERARH